MLQESAIEHLYVHVPFCAKKCAYCAFFSEAADGELIDRYVQSLLRELQCVAEDLKPATIFFGGGTPSLLSLRQWEQLLQTIRQLGWHAASEWTVECNPATISRDKARLLREGGVNRISMGAQSFDNALLDRLGRVHSRQMIFKSFDILRAAGFDNVNIDLMFAIPGQTLDSWRQSLAEAKALGSEHLSCYEVIYEEDTPLFLQLQAGAAQVDEDLACTMYDQLLLAAAAAGYQQYEVANFARACRGRSGVGAGPRLPAQYQLLARRVLLWAWPQRLRLCPWRPHAQLVQHHAVLRTVGERPSRHRIIGGTLTAGARRRDCCIRFAHDLRLAAGAIPAPDRL